MTIGYPTLKLGDEFSPGLYRHTRTGGLYTAHALVTHHETRRPMVLYTSHTYGGWNVRPLYGWPGDPDGWLDRVNAAGDVVSEDTIVSPRIYRFVFVGGLPSDTPITERR